MADKRTVWEVLIQLSAKGLKQVKKQLDGVKQRTSGLRSAQDKSQKSMNVFAKKAYEQRTALEQTGSAHGRLGGQMNRAGKSTDELRSKTISLSDVLRATGASTVHVMRNLDEGRFQSMAGHAAGLSRTFTLMSMAMLGVYYSTMSLVQGYGTLFNAVLSPLRRMEQTVQNVAMYWALTGKESDPTLIGRFVNAWLGLQKITGALMEGMMELAASVWEVAGDDILRNVETFAEALGDKDMVDSVSNLAIALSDALPDIAKMVIWIARLMESTSGLTKHLLLLSMVALTLMPIFAIMSGMAQMIRVAFLVASKGAALKTITIGALSLALWKFVAIGLAVIGVFYIIHRVITSNLDVVGLYINAVGHLANAFSRLISFLVNFLNMFTKINPLLKPLITLLEHMAQLMHNISGLSFALADTRRDDSRDQRGLLRRGADFITNNNTFQVEDKVDWEDQIEKMGIS